MAADFEATGNNPLTDIPVGIGLADDRGSIYVSLKEGEAHPDTLSYILTNLAREKVPLLAHNLFFDGAMATKAGFGFDQLNWLACTYAAYKLLATEGWPGQMWGLKHLMTDLLLRPESNEARLDNWLIDNGYVKNVKKEPTKGYYRRDGWQGGNGVRYVAPDKSRMSNAPSYILGPYCGLDSDATYCGWTRVLEPCMRQFPALAEFFHGPFMNLVRLLIDQKLVGISVDKEGMAAYERELTQAIANQQQVVFQRPEVQAFAKAKRDATLRAKLEAAPNQYRKFSLPKEPTRHTKAGRVSATWLNWRGRLLKEKPLISKNWLTWKDQVNTLAASPLEDHFNLNSGDQLRELIYGELKHEVVLTTDTGQPAVDKRAMGQWGDLGKELRLHSDKIKELSYVQAGLEHCQLDPKSGLYRIHPSFRVPGTLTGRLAGAGGLNLQQVPHSEGYLSCYRPVEGKAWVDVDFTSLENVVLAELSRDPTLYKLYGPGQPKQDAYLFNGANLRGTIRARLRAHGYDPDRPDAEAIERTKKLEKKWRTVAKVFTLSANYGAGPRKIHETLVLSGIRMSLEEVQDLHRAFWELYAGIKDWERELKRQWRANNGWVLNGIGRPIGVHPDYTKDLVNRVCQSTGHDILVIWVDIWSKMLDARGLEWSPVIVDFHDESLVECRAADVEEVSQVLKVDSFEELNRRLRGKIPLTGDGGFVSSLWGAKAG